VMFGRAAGGAADLAVARGAGAGPATISYARRTPASEGIFSLSAGL
jgi:hypothetical protein